MKKLLCKGKSLIAFVSVFAILAVSMFSVLTGVNFSATASSGIVSEFTTGENELSLLDPTQPNSKANPYIVENANQMYSLMIGNSTSGGEKIDSAGKYFKVADGIKAFYMNGGATVAAMTTPEQVREYFEVTNTGYTKVWSGAARAFKGSFDGNGVAIYGIGGDGANTGLFPMVGGDVTIKNVSVRNSYFKGNTAGGLVGTANGTSNPNSITAENCEVVNNYISGNRSDAGAGGLLGFLYNSTATDGYPLLTINNCMVYGNELIAADSRAPGAFSLAASMGGNRPHKITNSIFLGGDGMFNTASWWPKQANNYENVYTDADLSITGITYPEGSLAEVVADDLKGKNGLKKLSAFNFASVWFASEGMPRLRAFHEIQGTPVNVDGHNKEKDVCCGMDSIYDAMAPHVYVGDNCSICGYTYPCTSGHDFAFVPAKETSTEAPGNIAYNYCDKCQKKYAENAATNAPLNSALSEDDIVIPQILPYDTWNGQWDEYFWMNNQGDGSPANPFIIETAEQLASVATARLKYDASKPTAEGFDISKYTVSNNDLDTTGLSFKVKSGITAFYMNGGTATGELKNADEVKTFFEKNSGQTWWVGGIFKGNFDGNGSIVYGLYATKESAGLFPTIGPDVVITNITLENSYIKSQIAGGIFGQVQWYDGINNNATANIINSSVKNCYIESTSDKTDAGVAGGHIREHKLIAKSFLAYNNIVNNASNNIGGLLGEGWGSTDEVYDSVFIGTTPYSAGADKKRARGDNFKNVYTDQDLTAGETLVQIDEIYKNFKYEESQIKKLETSQMVGAQAPKNMTELDFGSVWFVSDGTIKLRTFHEITGSPVSVDGHNNEKDVCCAVDSVYDGVAPHVYEGESCIVCGYTYPCTNGHNFKDVPAVDASTEAPGNIAYKKCDQCQKNFADDAAIDAPISSALTNDEIIIPQILPYDVWDGTWDEYFWMNNQGDGSPANPFIIETAEQLASVTTARLRYDSSKPMSEGFDISKYTLTNDTLDTAGVFFKVKTGKTAFYMNGDTGITKFKNADEVKNYFEKTPGQNWWIGGIFKGNFNGNGATVYGLYSTKESCGLFPLIGPDVVIKNITLANSYFKGDSGSIVGGLFGQTVWFEGISNNVSVTVRNCAVVNCYLESNYYNKAADGKETIVDAGVLGGHIRELKLKAKNFLAYGNTVVNSASKNPGSIIGEGWSSTDEIYDSVLIGTTPYSLGADKSRARGNSFKNVYTDQDLTAGEKLVQVDDAFKDFKYVDSQITKLETAKMMGVDAQVNMPALDWVSMWKANENSYPTPRLLSIKDYAPGYAWTGEIAVEFSAGEGSKSNPYKISAPEYLALMLNMNNDGLYFELVSDIIINTSLDENAKQWFTSANVKEFNGNLEGNGHKVSGLYYNNAPANVSLGLIPVKGSGTLQNIKLVDSYINVPAGSYGGAVIGSIIDGAQKPIYMHGITVEDSVVVKGTGVGAGLVAKCGNAILRINNCISKASIDTTTAKAGIVTVTGGGISVKNSISATVAPFGSADAVVAKNVYTDAENNVKVDGVKTLTTADLQGENAKTNTALDFDTIWETTTSYPAIAGVINTSNGTVGDVWTGNVADSFAGGSGTIDDPYIITTGEMLAKCATQNKSKTHYKLAADIYLNDVNSPLWAEKIGCTEWFNSRTGSTWSAFENGSFDGDGYVVYGMYYNRQHYVDDSAFNGLFATLGENAQIKNIGISDAYLAGSKFKGENFNEFVGAITGYIVDWDEIELDAHDAASVKAATNDPEYYSRMPVISNCFVDNKSYLSGMCVGGLIGGATGTFRAENCIFTGTLDGRDKNVTGGISGQDMCNGAHYIDCVSFPQTCDRPLGGSANQDWRTEPNYFITTAIDVYYFAINRVYNTLTKISKPEQRVGEAAMKAMPGLDWLGNEEDGTDDLWRVVDGGTPMLTIFDKHRNNADIFSDKTFSPPEVTVSLVTGTTEVELEPLVGRMYSKMTLPTPTRPGYKFTGWYPHANLSVKYPYDYFPPRSLNLYAGWESVGVICNFENYTDTIWDYDDTRWTFNKPGAKGGYKNKYVRNGSKSMHLLDTSSEAADVLLNYDPMLEIGQSYEMTFWVTTDKADNPATQLSLVHNSKPVYLDTGIAIEDMVKVEKLTVGEWTQYKYSFKAMTKWVSIRATGNSSLYFDDIIIAPIETDINNSNILQLGTVVPTPDVNEISPATNDNAVSVAILISAIMACAAVIVVSRKNLVEIIED